MNGSVTVLVVGAGIIGASIADELARRGASVTVLDMRSPGRGASQASAGILAPYTEAHERTPLLDLGTRSLAMFDAFIEAVRERSGCVVDYARTGTLEVALTAEDETRLRASRAWLERISIPVEWLSAAEVRGEEPVHPSARGGLFNPAHGWVGVTSLVTALVESAKRSGAAFESPVDAVEVSPRRGGGAEIRAADRRYDADAVVLAAGSWSGRVRIAGAPALPVRPVRGQLLHLRWPATEPPPSRVIWSHDCYVVPWPDGSLLVGATVEDVGFDERVTTDGVRSLAAAAAELLPAAKAAEFVTARAGLRPAAPDGLPIIGGLPGARGVVAATAHYRNGVLLTPLTAALVAALLLDSGGDPALEIVSPDRFRE